MGIWMDTWHYVDGNGDRQGPVTKAQLVLLHQDGQLAADTQVQPAEGGDWQRLDQVIAHQDAIAPAAPFTTTPPPLPPPPAPTATPAASAPVAATRSAGPSGWALAGIISGLLGLFLLVMLGILSAIAFPAYQDYKLRARTSEVLWNLASLQARIVSYRTTEGRCPEDGDDAFADETDGIGLSELRVGNFDDEMCGIEGTLMAPEHAALDGKLLWLDYDPESGRWQCSSEVDDRFLPTHCRG